MRSFFVITTWADRARPRLAFSSCCWCGSISQHMIHFQIFGIHLELFAFCTHFYQEGCVLWFQSLLWQLLYIRMYEVWRSQLKWKMTAKIHKGFPGSFAPTNSGQWFLLLIISLVCQRIPPLCKIQGYRKTTCCVWQRKQKLQTWKWLTDSTVENFVLVSLKNVTIIISKCQLKMMVSRFFAVALTLSVTAMWYSHYTDGKGFV